MWFEVSSQLQRDKMMTKVLNGCSTPTKQQPKEQGTACLLLGNYRMCKVGFDGYILIVKPVVGGIRTHWRLLKENQPSNQPTRQAKAANW